MALGPWLDHYKHYRPHTALGGLTPMEVLVNNVSGNHISAGVVASLAGRVAYLGRSVVDEDIDIYDMNDIWSAMMSRLIPGRDVQILRRGWVSPLDQAAHADHRRLSSRAVIGATKPREWKDRFGQPVVATDTARATRERFGWILDPQGADPR